MSQKNVFISYSHYDKNYADKIITRLENENIANIYSQENIEFGENFYSALNYSIGSSDIVLLLLSKNSLESRFSDVEKYESIYSLIKKKKIILVPVVVEKCKISNLFLSYEIVDLTKDFELGIKKLIQRIRVIPEISFDNLTFDLFEDLIFDLLKEYGFKNIQKEYRYENGSFDFMAEYVNKSPFGIKSIEKWIIEAKFYKSSRIDINLLKQIRSYLTKTKKISKAILITNSNLTSIVEQYIEDIKIDFNFEILVIDGATLKKLIATRKRLLKKYFNYSRGQNESN